MFEVIVSVMLQDLMPWRLANRYLRFGVVYCLCLHFRSEKNEAVLHRDQEEKFCTQRNEERLTGLVSCGIGTTVDNTWLKEGRRGRWGRRSKQLLDSFELQRRYWSLKEEAPDRSHWRAAFGSVGRHKKSCNFIINKHPVLFNANGSVSDFWSQIAWCCWPLCVDHVYGPCCNQEVTCHLPAKYSDLGLEGIGFKNNHSFSRAAVRTATPAMSHELGNFQRLGK
jgi:hypothetical protein